jgi:SAM-dependent methyltransferase
MPDTNSNYHAGINLHLLNQVPVTAKKILEIGCGYGLFGEQVKARNSEVEYYAMELVPEAARLAATKLDHVVCGSIETTSFATDQFDCVIFGDVLEHLYNPLSALKTVRALLKPDGCVLCSVPNVQHHSVLAMLLAGDFQYQEMGLLDRTHVRFFTYASFIKLLLDSGFVPQIVDIISSPPSAEFFETLKGGLDFLKQDTSRAHVYLSAYQYIFKGSVNEEFGRSEATTFPITFIVPTNDRRVLGDNLLASPIFKGTHPHQLLLLENQASAASALEVGVRHAANSFVVYAHQDVYLPSQWDSIFCRNVTEAKTKIQNSALFGVYGACIDAGTHLRHGCVMDRHWYRNDGGEFPVSVESLDEMLFGFDRDSFPGADDALGYHLYGADIACRYRELNKLTVVVNALCFHNSGLGGTLPADFFSRMAQLRSKWPKYLPLATPCLVIGSDDA